MDDNTDARVLSTLPPEDWRRPQGWPRITWLSIIQQDLRYHNLTLSEAMDMAQNRSLWRMWSTYSATQAWVACQKWRESVLCAWWLSGCGTGLAINTSRVPIPASALSSATLGKLSIHVPMSPSSVIGTGQWVVMPCSWEGIHTSDVTLAMHHRR